MPVQQHPNSRDTPSGSVIAETPYGELQVLTWSDYAPEKGQWQGWLSTWRIQEGHLRLIYLSRKPLVGDRWDDTFANPAEILPASHHEKVTAFLQEAGNTVCHKCGYVWQTMSEKAWVTCPSCTRKTKRGSFCSILGQIKNLRAGLPVSGERRRLEILERQLTNGEISPEDAEREFREIEREVNP